MEIEDEDEELSFEHLCAFVFPTGKRQQVSSPL